MCVIQLLIQISLIVCNLYLADKATYSQQKDRKKLKYNKPMHKDYIIRNNINKSYWFAELHEGRN